MDQNFLLLIKQVSMAMEQDGRAQFRALDLSLSQGYVLDYLLSQKEELPCATELCELFGLSKSTLSALLNDLKNKGYLEMTLDPGDDRKKRIVLTKKAREEEKQIRGVFIKQLKKAAGDICFRRLAQLEYDLRTVRNNLQKERQEGTE